MGHSRQERILEEQAGLALLESADMRAPLEQAVHSLGARLTDWKLLQIHHRPGAGVSGIYEVGVQNSDGQSVTDFLCATSANVGEPETPVLRLRQSSGEPTGSGDQPASGGAASGCLADGCAPDGDASAEAPMLTLWRHPLDPLLPGLAWACDAGAVAEEIFGQPGAAIELSTASYRPLRRAVIRAALAEETAYLKIVRRGHGAALWQRHQLLAAAGIPVPVPYREPVNDVVALRELRGTPLANELLANGAAQLDPAGLLALLRRLPAAALELPERPAWALRAGDYAQAAAAALPQERDRIMNVAAKIVGLLPSTDPGPLVPTHGDFYEANLLVDGDAVTGVLDVDAVGPGHLVDDLACFIGHLAVLPAVDRRYELVPAAMDRFLHAFDTEVDPAGLRIRAAGVALSLIAGAKRAHNALWEADALGRLAATEQLAEAAVSRANYGLPESSLIQHSSTSHFQPAT